MLKAVTIEIYAIALILIKSIAMTSRSNICVKKDKVTNWNNRAISLDHKVNKWIFFSNSFVSTPELQVCAIQKKAFSAKWCREKKVANLWNWKWNERK